MAFVQRKIRLTFLLGEGTFGESGTNKIVLENLRVTARIIKAGGTSMSEASLQVYGMTLSEMNKIATLGMKVTLIRKNSVIVEASDDKGAMTTVFQGTIFNAWGEFSEAPNVPFNVQAFVALFEAVAPADPSSYKNGVSVAVVMESLAKKMGLTFENNGVTTMLPTSYFDGSAREQALKAANAAHIGWIIDNNKLIIWPLGQARGNSTTLVASPGLVSYPTFDSQGIRCKHVFNPTILFGGKITVKSTLTPACGDWLVYMLDYDLHSQVPHGKWEMNIAAYRGNLGPVV